MNILNMQSLVKKKIKRCRLVRLVIRALFNKFDYEFNFDKKENISIIIAPNGCGKTTILNFINFLLYPSRETYDKIKSIPVKSVKCYTNTGVEVSYERLEEEYILQNIKPEIKARMDNYKVEVGKIKSSVGARDRDFLPIINELLKVGLLGKTGNNVTLDNFNYKFIYKTKKDFKEINFLDELNAIYSKMSQQYIPNEDSLIVNIQSKIIQKIITYKECFIEYITTQRTQSKFNNVSFTQFITKIVAQSVDRQKNMNELEKGKETNKLLSAINNISFLIQAKSEITHLLQSAKNPNILNKRISLMQNIFNKRNLVTNKQIAFFKEDGFIITQNNKEIPLGCLSSGEVNDFALFFRIIFNKYDSPICLIDEPEISLHIDWQEEMIDWLLKIAKLNKMQIILATHSPNIINCHYNLILNGNVKVYE